MLETKTDNRNRKIRDQAYGRQKSVEVDARWSMVEPEGLGQGREGQIGLDEF